MVCSGSAVPTNCASTLFEGVAVVGCWLESRLAFFS